ncbi:MAG: hypothetical protein OXU74_06715 [Gemmatimonadota bacterium]|nr:hypothetical protein [Gemmatimonadota bacterium]
MIILYADQGGLRQIIQGHVSGMAHRTAPSASVFRILMATEARIGVVGTLDCTDGLVRLLKSALQLDMADGPRCIVVTRVTFDNLRHLRDIEGDRLHVVWIEEIEECLPKVLDKAVRKERVEEHLPRPLDHVLRIIEEAEEPHRPDPLRRLGLWLLSDLTLDPPLARAVRLVCRVEEDDNGSVPPAMSVAELAKRVDLHPAKLGYLWKTRIPLRCTMRQMIQWSALLWAIRNRNDRTWKDIAREIGITGQTLGRYSQSLAQAPLHKTTTDDPAQFTRRFTEWLSRVATSE